MEGEDLPPLPQSLQRLVINNGSTCKITSLPPGLVSLRIEGKQLASLESFPPSLRTLIVKDSLRGPLHSIPYGCSIKITAHGDDIAIIP